MRHGLLSIVLAVFPLSASAQVVCPEGLVSSDKIHCCWPGQSWSADSKTCAGEPECPAGYVARDGSCLSPAAQRAIPAGSTEPEELVKVGFRAAEAGDRFTISSANGSCETPCSLMIPRGKSRIEVRGSASYRTTLRLRDSEPVEVKVERRHGEKVALGATCLGIGGGTVILGLMATLLATHPDVELYEDRAREIETAGFLAMVAGGLVAVAGGPSGLRNKGHNRLSIVAPERGEGPQLIGLGLSPTTDRGMTASAAFSF